MYQRVEMINIINFFDNREWAVIIWVTLALVVCFFSKKLRESIIGILKSFINVKILVPFVGMALYTAIFVYIISLSPFWNSSVLKDSSLWFLISSFPLIYNATRTGRDKKSLKFFIIQNLKLGALIEYIFGLYPFSFISELFLQPIIAIIATFIAVCQTNKKYKIVENIFIFLLMLITFTTLWHAAKAIVHDPCSFTNRITLTEFLVPIYLTITIIPFLALLSLWSKYEQDEIMRKFKLQS